MTTVYVARQPIFELGRGLFGYELLYRRDDATDCADGDDMHMSAEVIVSSVLSIGMNAVASDGVAFINFSQQHVLDESWTLLDPNGVVIELLETVECTPETLAACRRMVQAGYKLALDDYVYSERTRPLLALASIVKVDVLGKSAAELEAIARQLKPARVRMLAERVETAETRDVCAKLGFELFQGYLFSRPQTVRKTDVSPGQLAIMRLLNLLQDPATPDASLDAAFQSDVALSYKLLRIVNAASMGGRGVSSIPHAVRLVGRETLHRWLSVLLVASLGHKGDVTHELALTSITRARMCELLTGHWSEKRHGASAFIVGLLSLLDVLLEMPMQTLLSRLELSPEVRGALLERGGPLGLPLQIVEEYEQANWDRAAALAKQSAVPNTTLPNLYIDALNWASVQVSAA